LFSFVLPFFYCIGHNGSFSKKLTFTIKGSKKKQLIRSDLSSLQKQSYSWFLKNRGQPNSFIFVNGGSF